ncbi:hypothetical protein P5V15_011928 [Pogonomyrmex californicus]
MRYTCIQGAHRKKRWLRARNTIEVLRYGTVENRQDRGQSGEEHPLFRGGSLHGSAHPNSLHSLDPGVPGGSLPPPAFRTYSRKLGIVDTEPMVRVSQLRRDENGRQASRVFTFVLLILASVVFLYFPDSYSLAFKAWKCI